MTDSVDMHRSAVRPEVRRGMAAPQSWRGCAPPSSRRSRRIGGLDLRPRAAKRDEAKPAPHVPPIVVGICLAPLIEFALNAEYPNFVCLVIYVHSSLLRHASLPSSCFPSPCTRLSRAPTTTEAPPSVSSVSGRRGEPSSELGRRSKFPRSDP